MDALLSLNAGTWVNVLLFDHKGNKVQEETISAQVLHLSLFTQLGFYEDLDSVIDATQTQLIALVTFDIRISVIVQRGVAGLNWSAAASVFDCLAQRLEGKHIPLAFKG